MNGLYWRIHDQETNDEKKELNTEYTKEIQRANKEIRRMRKNSFLNQDKFFSPISNQNHVILYNYQQQKGKKINKTKVTETHKARNRIRESCNFDKQTENN